MKTRFERLGTPIQDRDGRGHSLFAVFPEGAAPFAMSIRDDGNNPIATDRFVAAKGRFALIGIPMNGFLASSSLRELAEKIDSFPLDSQTGEIEWQEDANFVSRKDSHQDSDMQARFEGFLLGKGVAKDRSLTVRPD